MLFNTVQFFLFLAVVLALFYTAPRAWRKYILLAASYFFYASWNPKFIALLLTLTAIDYSAGIALESVRPARKKLVLILSLSANLGFLGFFKYYNFLAGNLAALIGRPPRSFWLDIVLPLGISFHTFQSMSYVVDVYRGEQRAIRNPIDYALFICFFPQLVAGPIVRARDFFRDLLHWNPPGGEDVARGLFLFTLGLTKKMAFADPFAQVADNYFSHVAQYPGIPAAWSGVFAFGMQIYFDFSGYTDMAIGMAKLFGFHFPENFRRPYLASSITEFWRRWHISLSTWLRDYLYIPLGGNRHGAMMTYRNLMLTMLLGGLWHGASWNFVIWGALHGIGLATVRLWQAQTGTSKASGIWRYLSIFVTFHFVTFTWIFFRASTLDNALAILSRVGSLTASAANISTPLALILILGAVAHYVPKTWYDVSVNLFVRAPFFAQAIALAALVIGLQYVAQTGATPFIYNKF
jgi:D-alanyl-lipoteichoic acid acyltransferase DltB (MBOAT superfamily)